MRSNLNKQMGVIGDIIGAVGGLIAGKQRDDATAKANKANIKYQKQFAQQGIQWRVADAKAAGLHPLAAIGAQTGSFTPVIQPEAGVADGLASAGQSIGRAVDKSREKPVTLPTGPVVYPDGSNWPHYSDKNGKAVPYSAEQVQIKNSLEAHDAQMQVMRAETQNLLAQAQGNTSSIPEMFVTFNHPDFGPIPMPNPQLGESVESLKEMKRISGLWLNELRKTPGLYEAINRIAVYEYGRTAKSLLQESPDLLHNIVEGFLLNPK